MGRKLALFFMLFLALLTASAQNEVRGIVKSGDQGMPLPGVSVRIKGTNKGTFTDRAGGFVMSVGTNDTIVVSFMGYSPQSFAPPFKTPLDIILETLDASLNEVVISTGYQTLPKERATGSFLVVDDQLLNRSVSTNILDRLKDVVPGLSFNNNGSSAISIRGQSTIYGNAEPLIIVDNFPFEGSMQDINPNDVEQISILRDAAAASIWGARAGNGVIVITTKKGKLNQATQVTFNSNINVANAPDLYAASRLSSSDYIDIEKRLFEQGYYDASHSTGFEALTPVVELLYRKKADPSMGGAIDQQIEALKSRDVREELSRYVQRKMVNAQYAASLRGGGTKNNYYVSLGYDRNRENLVGNELSRISLSGSNTFKLLQNKLEITTGTSYTLHSTTNNSVGTTLTNATAGGSLYPYAQLADQQGKHLPIIKNYRTSFLAQAAGQGLLDWSYVPLDEPLHSNFNTKRRTVRLNGAVAYNLVDGLKASLRYQFTDMEVTGSNERSQGSYFARDVINRFTQIAGTSLNRPIPLGGILDLDEQSLVDHGIRLQVDYQKNWGNKHELTAIAGHEIRYSRTERTNHRYYGYNSEYAQNTFVNYAEIAFPMYFDNARKGQIPFVDALGLYNDRFRSYYANGAYTYIGRYTINTSARLDQSNLFGVKTNQKGVPLWSVGLSWNLDKESFFPFVNSLPLLKIRATYGYNGNVDKTVSAFTTASFSGNRYSMPFATILNPPNPDLRWEKVAIWNLGLDFATKGNRLSGAVELYHKKGMDLIGDMPMPPSSGVALFRGNMASTAGTGLELLIHSINTNGRFVWATDLVFAAQREKVTEYFTTATSIQYLQSGLNLPLKGKTLYGLYGYPWAGLDNANGDPLGYLNGLPSKDYAAVMREFVPEKLNYHGSIRPTTFGSLRNTFSYKDLSISFSIAYRLGYVFRKNSVVYGNNLGLASNNGDYALRWNNPGDEQNTQVPSLPTSVNNNRDLFYRYADVLVDRADNIRLQDIRAEYGFRNRKWLPFQQLALYGYCSNISLLWKRTKFDVDPDIPNGNYPLSVAVGLKFNFN